MSILRDIKKQVTDDDIASAKEVIGCFVFGAADENATLADARLALNEVADVFALLRITGYYIVRKSEALSVSEGLSRLSRG